MSISDKQDDSNEAGKLLKHLTEGLHHWKKRWLFHLLHYFIASYALIAMDIPRPAHHGCLIFRQPPIPEAPGMDPELLPVKESPLFMVSGDTI